MLGIFDYWAFVAAVLAFLALPGPSTLALLYCLTLCAFASAIRDRLRANQRLVRAAQRVAGIALIGFGLKLAQ